MLLLMLLLLLSYDDDDGDVAAEDTVARKWTHLHARTYRCQHGGIVAGPLPTTLSVLLQGQ